MRYRWDLATVSPDHASEMISVVDRLQEDTRQRLRGDGWQWLLVWAVIFGGASLVSINVGEILWYWAIALPIGMLLTALVDHRVRARAGVRPRDWPYWVTGLGISFLNFTGGAVLPPMAAVVWCWVMVGLGFACFAHLERLPQGAVLLLGMSGLSIVAGIAIDDPRTLHEILGAAFAVVVTVIALSARPRRPRLR
ncbi:hypothetical protein BH23ACT5_BH23ACT5_05690 [soil metagenome]